MNVLDALPKQQPEAAERLSTMMYAESRSACERKRDEFLLLFKKTDPNACATLSRDWERLVRFFDYPQEHWIHLRTTNIVESPFNAVRLRTDASRPFKKYRERPDDDLEVTRGRPEILACAQRAAPDA